VTSDACDAGLFVRPAFLDDAACRRLRAAMDAGSAAAAEVIVDDYVVDEEVRRTLDVEVDDEAIREVERRLEGLRHELSAFFGETLTRTEGPAFLRYPTGGFYRAHHDRPDHSPDELPRRISIVLFLTTAECPSGDGRCEGGSLRLYGMLDPSGDSRPLDIPPSSGTLVAFPSTILHEVLPVTAGVRDAIVDWFY
jgi:predicted 2-oxoglutarate/Fe(II)-dependent dioxygenase YbiX